MRFLNLSGSIPFCCQFQNSSTFCRVVSQPPSCQQPESGTTFSECCSCPPVSTKMVPLLSPVQYCLPRDTLTVGDSNSTPSNNVFLFLSVQSSAISTSSSMDGSPIPVQIQWDGCHTHGCTQIHSSNPSLPSPSVSWFQ